MVDGSDLNRTLSGASTAVGASNSVSPGGAGRNLVLCFDGTSNTFSEELTNLPILYSLLEADPKKQLCYYQTGIGTYDPVYTPSGLVKGIAKLADEAIAWDLGQHVQDGYRFLMNTFKPEDRIYLFGFSRGAYQARALAGMLQQVGLLLPHNSESVSLAFSIYKRKADTPFIPPAGGSPGINLAAAFKRDFSREVNVHFVGVWDTVSSVGAIIPRTLPFASGNMHIRHFRHAMALDEARARFAYQPWIAPTDDETSNHVDLADSRNKTIDLHGHVSDVKEIWFAGAHSDVGGGASPTDDGRGPRLSNLSLRWMIREAMDKGLLLDEERLLSSLIFPPPLVYTIQERLKAHEPIATKYVSSSPSIALGTQTPLLVATVNAGSREEEWTKRDALAPRHNSLSMMISGGGIRGVGTRAKQRFRTFFWWLIEFMPTVKIVWDAQGEAKRWSAWPNFGRPRTLTKSPVCHISVRQRMANNPPPTFAAGDGHSVPESRVYKPKAKLQDKKKWQNMTFEA